MRRKFREAIMNLITFVLFFLFSSKYISYVFFFRLGERVYDLISSISPQSSSGITPFS